MISIPHNELPDKESISRNRNICSSCGGNGYTKSAPNSYKTCLRCLATGYIPLDQ